MEFTTNYEGLDKQYNLPAAFTALNGTIQYYEVTFTNVDVAADQANLLRALEVLRTRGGQPIITKVDGKTIYFTLEQANVFGKNEPQQVSKKDLIADAEQEIKDLFANVLAVDGTTKFTVDTVVVNPAI